MNLSPILKSSAFKESFILRQRGRGVRNDDGIFIQVQENLDILLAGSVQPMPSRDRLDLPEGERVSEGIVAYVKNNIDISALRVGTDATNGDILIVKGILYLIRAVSHWQDHYKILATRMEGQ